MIVSLLALPPLLVQWRIHPPPPKDPRTVALRTRDAIYAIEDVTGSAKLVSDCDGDGLEDLAIGRGGGWPQPLRIDLVSSRTGATIRTLGELPRFPADYNWREPPLWDAGADMDGDHSTDLVVGDPNYDHFRGRIVVTSGARGKVILERVGDHPRDRLGSSVVFLGDLDRDGHDDLIAGAGEYDDRSPPYREIRSLEMTQEGGEAKRFVVFVDGTRVTEEWYYEDRLRARSTSPGQVRAISGRDGKELWRVYGKVAGHAFGSHVAAVGDLDGDGIQEVLVQCELGTGDPLVILSGATGHEIARLPHRGGPAGGIGDVDGDRIPDLFVDKGDTVAWIRLNDVAIVSGRSRETLFTLPYPDFWSEYGVTVAMGDLDGDGFDDIALGDGNFHLRGPGDPGYQAGLEDIDLSKKSLFEAMCLVSDPWCAFTWESGCAVIYSGKTRDPMFGVWAEPGSREGLGMGVSRLPDITGDGYPDVLVSNGTTTLAFRGPGAAPK